MRKRNLFDLTALLAVLAMCFGLGLSSCSDDNDSGEVTYEDLGQYFVWDPEDPNVATNTIDVAAGDTVIVMNNGLYYKVIVDAAKPGEVVVTMGDSKEKKLNKNEGMYFTTDGRVKLVAKAATNPGSVLFFLKDGTQTLETPKKSSNSTIKGKSNETWFARPF